MEKPYRLTVGPPETAAVGNWGEFTLIRPFVVEGGAANGFIVQHIEREAAVIVHQASGTRTLKTSAEISDFTSGNVQNASGEYYELFVVENGNVLDRDQFQGGAALRYVSGFADDDPPTSGKITIRGKSVFVPSTPDKVTEVKIAMGRAEAAGATRLSTRFSALGETWSTFVGTPANGLPFLETATVDLFALAASNTLNRLCIVKWDRTGKTTLEETSDPVSPPIRRRSGGSIHGRTASRSTRRRRTGRARRRSSHRARAQRYRTVRCE